MNLAFGPNEYHCLFVLLELHLTDIKTSLNFARVFMLVPFNPATLARLNFFRGLLSVSFDVGLDYRNCNPNA